MSAAELIRAGDQQACRPWPRCVVSPDTWAKLAAMPELGPALLGMWADTQQVHALCQDQDGALIASVGVENGRYPALSPACPPAARFERMIRDLWGHAADGATDDRAWLDHGRWPMAHPLSPRPGMPGGSVEPPQFPAVEAPGLTQVPLGPVHGLIAEPAHLRLVTQGDTVLRAEARLGYAHKGILALMRGKSPRAAARFIARLAAEATVAHSVAFARAAEAALGRPAPPRAAALRVVMLEQERLAGGLDVLGQLADAACVAPLHAALGREQEHLLRAADQVFGHRLMMDVVVPGGLAADIAPDGVAVLRQACLGLTSALPGLRRRMEPLLGRLDGLGIVTGPPASSAVARLAGDAAARCRRFLAGIAAAAGRLQDALAELPEGPVTVALPAESGEGVAGAGSPRGTVWHWMRLDHGQIAAAFPLDPGWLLWPLAEAAMAGAAAEEAVMVRLSCGLPCAALDL
ncbi:MAG TPA: hypothetical protein VMB34_18895 [Acetobacteraceae bacterium]|nr:hypothetical protein [Acetobacteraceae bacterium]